MLMLMFKTIITLLGIIGTNCMVVNPFGLKNLNFLKLPFHKDVARVIDPIDDQPTNRTVIFFPATTVNRLPTEIYNDFLYSLAENNMQVCIPSKNNIEILIEDLNKKNRDITIIGHSTAAIDAIQVCQNTDIINNLVLIDPLDTRGIVNDEDSNVLTLNTIDKLVIFNSEKSNDWKLLPIVIPIGVFALDIDTINLGKNTVKEIINSETFGHFDILDNVWSNMIHKTISKGSTDRNPLKLHKYRQWLAIIINRITNPITSSKLNINDMPTLT